MFPGSRRREKEKQQERLRQQKVEETKQALHSVVVAYIEDDDLDGLKEYVPSKMAIDAVLDEFLFY